MEDLIRRYAQLIIQSQLKLRPGDSVSINTEAAIMGFARYLAKEATMVTGQTVTIVETNHGKVIEAIPIEPEQQEIFRPPVQAVVMCHLFDLDASPYLQDLDLGKAVEDVGLLARFGHLSEPVFLDRRIAVAWANVPYPGNQWAANVLGRNASEEETWLLFGALFRLDSDWASSFWDEQANLLEYRKQRLNALGRVDIKLIGDGWECRGSSADDTQWAGGRQMLKNGRIFSPMLPMQSIHVPLDATSTQGTLRSSRPFYVLGKEVIGATFTIRDGKVTHFEAEQGKEALAAFFSIDEGAARVAELSLADNDTIESRYLGRSVHAHFAKEMTTTLVLGGFSLDTLKTQQTEDDIVQSKLNQSLVRLEIPVGDDHLSVVLTKKDGEELEVVTEGVHRN
ncbi:aminopeptidase [Sphaerochaeta sp.]|uniref:aminopeptidase n=1 Tax=Sphaerochaeta sp. TaxID=1972642 RepID=UPI002FCB230A